jgi:hypothetical protein
LSFDDNNFQTIIFFVKCSKVEIYFDLFIESTFNNTSSPSNSHSSLIWSYTINNFTKFLSNWS